MGDFDKLISDMAWIELHQTLPRHPKLARLANRLRITRAQAAGHLTFLWLWALDYSPTGDLSALEPAEISAAAEFGGDPELFASALKQSGWVDGDGKIHDWMEYAGRLMHERVQSKERMKQYREKQRAETSKTDTLRDVTPNVRVTNTERAKLPYSTQPNPTKQNQPTTPIPPCAPASSPEASATAALVQKEPSAVSVSPEASKTPEGGKAAQGDGSRKRSTPMQIPTLDEVKLHAAKIGLPETEAQKFYGYYESNGWRVGKNPMRSWTGAMTNWKGNYDERRTGPAGPHHGRTDGNPPAIRSEAGMAGIDQWRDDFKREADNHVNDDLPFV